MREIPLGRGVQAIVDDEDFERFGGIPWHISARRYAAHSLPGGKSLYLHREIVAAPRGSHVDHINHDTFDNRRENLRIVTTQQNLQNRAAVPSNSTTHRLGVTWDKARGKYVAQVHHDGCHVFLGRFDTLAEAAASAQTGRKLLMTHAAAWMVPDGEG